MCLRAHLDVQSETPGAVMDAAFAEYRRCYRDPGCIHVVCEDYRASVEVDREQTRADRAAGRKITQPLLAIWGAKGAVGKMFDVAALRKQEAGNVCGQELSCGHLFPEEQPDALLSVASDFLAS